MKPVLALHLYHGRYDKTENLDDWGMEGPHIAGMDYVQTTYGSTMFIKDEFIRLYNDMIYFRGVYYGDWSLYIAYENDGQFYWDIECTQPLHAIRYNDVSEDDFEETPIE